MLKFLKKYNNYSIIILLTLVGRALGFGRELASAYYLGANEMADGLVVGLLPLVLFVSIFGTAYANAAIVQIRDLRDRRRICRTLPPIIFVGLLASPLLYVFNEPIINFLAPGLGTEGMALAAPLAAATGLSLLFVTLAVWSKAILQLGGHFTRASIGDIAPNIGMIIGIAILFPIYGIAGIAGGAVCGYFAQWLISIQLRYLRLRLEDWRGIFCIENRIIYRNTLLAALSYSVVYVELVVDRYFASQAGDGAIATMNYAQKIMILPLHTLFLAIGTVVFPRLIAAAGEDGGIARASARLYRITLTLAVPITIAGILLGPWAASLLLGYGKLGDTGAANVGAFLQVYMLAFISLAMVEIATKVRYAESDFRTPLIAGLSAAVVKLGTSALLFPWLGLNGLILSTAIAATVNCVILLYTRRSDADHK